MPFRTPDEAYAEALRRIEQAEKDGSTDLDLRRLELTALPPEIGRLTKLTALDLSGNQLSSLPTEIGRLNRLTSLTLSRNALVTFPSEIGRLTNLTSLEVGWNRLASVPAEIGELTNLTNLGVALNVLVCLPAEIGRLNKLERLYLPVNELASLPAEIGRLTKLKQLDLEQNQLASLPSELGRLENLETLKVGINPLPPAMQAAAERGTNELLAYLRGLAEGPARYEVKVLLVGEGNVGKSSLLEAIKGEKFVKDRATTHGIEIERVVQRTRMEAPYQTDEAEQKIVLNFWDFGGQQVYRITHQLFFSPNALYILVWKPREGSRENAVQDWLERIRLRVGQDARVLIVATHRNDRFPELDFPALKAEFGDILIVPPAEVDCADGRGIEELRDRIVELASDLKQGGTAWPETWHAAMEEIRELDESHITYKQFDKLCAGHGLDATDTSALIAMMDRVGHLVYYDVERLRDFVVLDPEWVTKSIGYLFEDEMTREKAGVLEHYRLKDVWVKRDDTGEPYDPADYPFFLDLMEKYDICYRMDEGRSLVGQLVPYERPTLPWEAATPTEQMQMSLTCRMSSEPPGVIAWTTVRSHRWSIGKHWRSGVFLLHPDGNEALFELLTPTELSITVRGPWPSQFMSLLRDGLEHLLKKEWRGLTYDLHIPCPGVKDEPGTCSDDGFFIIENLQKAVKKAIPNVQCADCFTMFPPANLMVGHVPPSRPPVDVLQEMIVRFDSLDERVDTGFARLKAQGAECTRWVLRTMLSEARDGPRLFTLEPAEKSGWDKLKIGTDIYKLTLWCEHPGHEHACGEDGTYVIGQPKEWLMKVGPCVALTAKCLRVAVPIAAASAGLPIGVLPEDVKPRLDFMDTLVTTLLGDASARPRRRIKDEDLGWSREEGAGLRAFHQLLREADKEKTHAWGGLRRVSTPANDVFWVCPNHYTEYEKGLPKVP